MINYINNTNNSDNNNSTVNKALEEPIAQNISVF